MKIKRFSATKVHGYLNFEINFNDRITFLIGINGTGKTSVLKLILGLISPSYKYLNSIAFESAELVCNIPPSGDVTILATNLAGLNKIELSIKFYNDVSVTGTINILDPILLTDFEGEDSNVNIQSIIDNFDQQEVVKRIKELSTPLFLGLDRRIYEGQQIDKLKQSFMFRRRYRHYPQNDPLNKSLMEIQEVIYDYVRLIASEQPQINQDFKNKIILQSFEFLESQEMNIIQDFKELKEKRNLALEAFNNLNITGFNEQVNKFFDQLEFVLTQINKKQKENIKHNEKSFDIKLDDIQIFQKWFSNQPQLRRIIELINYNQAYQNEIEKLYEPLEKTKKIINTFFTESKKELLIEPQGELKVKFSNGNKFNIFELSSGEKQIITMLGHLIYFAERNRNETGIFIIDEPEVSLHLAWQEIFVKSILEASPNTQFILATHSPAIVADSSDDLCQDLAKLN